MQITENISSKKGFRKIHSLRIDMTPMVDLGFLLITFFIFTSQMIKPQALDLKMPKDEGDPTPTKCSTSFTILASDSQVAWYECADGDPAGFQKSTLPGMHSLRNAIIKRRDQVAAAGKATDMVVMIKPLESCEYSTLINLLDEMLINNITRYAIVEPDRDDLRRLE
ncbi:biopolymer transporter ExbD [Pollutibacter soli]|uniref:ExbD/TolR family protein n=1 Tax=Pollutibacter soli TaxID=3034157 RepID=UPI0030134974